MTSTIVGLKKKEKVESYLDNDSLDYDPECPHCREGLIEIGGKFKNCECVRKKEAYKRVKEINSKYPMPVMLREKSFENFKMDNEYQERALDLMQGGKPCYLFGPWGSGKTHLLAATVNKMQRKFTMALLVSAPWLFEKVRRDLFQNWEIDILNMACTVEYLAIDDIGKEKPTGMIEEKLFMIVDRRLNEGKRTSFSSNFPLDDKRLNIDNAIKSRINEMCEIVFVNGIDHRKEGQKI